jgi:hypothetical protein
MPVIPCYSELFRIRSSCIIHGKDEVISSILIKGSNKTPDSSAFGGFNYDQKALVIIDGIAVAFATGKNGKILTRNSRDFF